jgi:hypothetical protein
MNGPFMRKTMKAIFWILGLPCMVQAQDLSYRLSLHAGTGHPVQPGYFNDYYQSSSELGIRLGVMFSDRSGAEFDFAAFSYRLDGTRLVESLAASGKPDAVAANGRIRMDTATLSYLYFLTPEESGPVLCVLAGIGMDRVEAEEIRITTPGADPDAPVERNVDSMNGGFIPSLCAGIGLTVAVSEKISVFGEARIHAIIVKGVTDVVSGKRTKDFVEFWTPAVGLRYAF